MCRWEFYFAYCEAAFDCNYIRDLQIVWERSAAASSNRHLAPSHAEQVLLSRTCRANKAGSRMTASTTVALGAVYCVLAALVIARQPRMLAALLAFLLAQGLQQVRRPLAGSLLPPRVLAFLATPRDTLGLQLHLRWAVHT